MGNAKKSARKKTATRAYFIAEDTTALREHYGRIVEENAKHHRFSDPLAQLAEELGIKLGVDLQTTAPLRNLLEGKKIASTSKGVFEEKLKGKIVFRPVKVALKGRPKRPCALADMQENGARIGYVPNHAYFSQHRVRMLWVMDQINRALAKLGVPKLDVNRMLNRQVARALEDGLHFVIGAAETIDNQPFIEPVHMIHDQSLGILARENITEPGPIVVHVGTAEEAILRSLEIEPHRILGLDFGSAADAHKSLFDYVKAGNGIAAASSALAVNNYLAAQSGLGPKMFDRFNEARLAVPPGETKSISLDPEPIHAVDGTRLINVASGQLDDWLREHVAYKGEGSVLDLHFPLWVSHFTGASMMKRCPTGGLERGQDGRPMTGRHLGRDGNVFLDFAEHLLRFARADDFSDKLGI